MRSLFRATTSLTFGLLFVGALAGCGGATTPNGGSAPAPSPTVAVDRQAAGLMCAPLGDCGVGDIGPGGGVVFYDAGSTQPWGRYMEAAPAGWNGGSEDPNVEWCTDGTGTRKEHPFDIGSGATNTQIELNQCPSGAGALAAGYRGGGKSDWFLASKDELNELYEQRETVGGFGNHGYWSSSQDDLRFACSQFFPSGNQGENNKWAKLGDRPIRVF